MTASAIRVSTVDAFGAAKSSLYSSNGCTLATPPAVLSSTWTKGRYTTCTAFDSYAAQATSQQIGGNSYSASYAYTNVDQIWQEPLNGGGTEQQALYCNGAHPHLLTGIYPIGTTCANLANASYSASYDAWGNLTNRTYNGNTATLSYDALDHLTQWNAGSNNQGWYVYDALGQRVL